VQRDEILREKILGISFFNGTAAEAITEINRIGGLLVCPASPALVKLRHDEGYRLALQQADVALADSNFLAFLWKIITGHTLRHVSGLTYIKSLLSDASFRDPQLIFWVVSSERLKQRAMECLHAYGLVVDPQNFWISEPGKDYELLQEIEICRPDHVVIATGAAGQEKLGLYFRDYLMYRPKIHCLGAALGFLTSEEHPIPDWAERTHLGWLFRFIAQPAMIIPRLGIACLLAGMVLRYRDKLPPLKKRWADV
jgi:UDP-N-acetyl-D-mannosaminuronic acid transferase (WecB/TagA/CpsF family)